MVRAGYIHAVTAQFLHNQCYSLSYLLNKTANPVGVREDGCHRNVRRYSQKLMEVGKTIHGQSGRAKAKKRVDKLYRRTGYIHAVTVQSLYGYSSVGRAAAL